MISDIDTIVPTLTLIEEATNAFNASTVLYNSSTVTYSDSGQLYGGIDINVSKPKIGIANIDSSPTSFYDIEDL